MVKTPELGRVFIGFLDTISRNEGKVGPKTFKIVFLGGRNMRTDLIETLVNIVFKWNQVYMVIFP